MGDWPRRLAALRSPCSEKGTRIPQYAVGGMGYSYLRNTRGCGQSGCQIICDRLRRYQVHDSWVMRGYVAPSTAQ